MAFTRGYNHRASGRVDQLQVSTMHPDYCQVHVSCTPSMKRGTYHLYLLLRKEGEVAITVTATCECAAG